MSVKKSTYKKPMPPEYLRKLGGTQEQVEQFYNELCGVVEGAVDRNVPAGVIIHELVDILGRVAGAASPCRMVHELAESLADQVLDGIEHYHNCQHHALDNPEGTA